MENVYNQLDSIFEHGLINSSISILLVLVFVVILNHILNKYIQKKYSHNLLMAKRIKKVILISIVLWCIFTQITPLQSLATTLLASGGIIAVVVGLASQEAASNIINGLMIYAYKPFVANDYINIISHNVTGTVLDITLRHTIIETLEKTQVIIPNTIMNNAVIENISNVPDKKANYLYIDISYESDIDKAITLIQEECSKHPLLIDPRTTNEKKQNITMIPVRCVEFKDSGVALRATVYSKDNAEGFTMLSDLRINIKKAFDSNGIEIPYPHVTLKN